VVALHAKGGPGVAIALEMGLVRQTVMRWLHRGRYPERRIVPAHAQLPTADRASRPTTRTSRRSIARSGGSAGLRPPAQHWFTSLADAEQRLRAWQSEYNNSRPHSSLEHHPPAHRGIGGYFIPAGTACETSASP
jgi:transposase InsO family protein